MPESPDFDQIARASIDALELDDYEFGSPALRARIVETHAEQLRLVWNARGAADIAKLDATLTGELSEFHGPTALCAKALDQALRSLDR